MAESRKGLTARPSCQLQTKEAASLPATASYWQGAWDVTEGVVSSTFNALSTVFTQASGMHSYHFQSMKSAIACFHWYPSNIRPYWDVTLFLSQGNDLVHQWAKKLKY